MTHAETAPEPQLGPIRVAEVLSAFSLATDLGAGQPMGDVLRMCYMAMGIAQELKQSEREQADVFHAALLAHAGCTAGASLFASLIHGDELAAHRDLFLRDLASTADILKWMLRYVAADEPISTRVLRLVDVLRGKGDLDEQIQGVCEVAPRLAARLGMYRQVGEALRCRLERWDGRGPQGLRGEEIPLIARITPICMVLVRFYQSRGREAAEEAARQKRGTVLDPGVVDGFLSASRSDGFWAGLSAPDLWDTILELEPESPAGTIGEDRIEDVALAFADFAELKTAHKAGHARSTADIAGAVAAKMGLPQSSVSIVRRAALVHDIGEVGIPGRILVKEGALEEWEVEQVRLHPHYTERILSRVPALRPVATIAGAQHEWVNGRGYHRGLSGSRIPVGARILALADAFQELVEGRPGHPGVDTDEALGTVSKETGSRFDPDCCEALSQVTGVTIPKESLRREWPAGLTDREVDVLRVAATGLTKRQMAQHLTISEKTVGTHLEHIYGKIGCSSRAAAVLFAMEQGLLTGTAPARGRSSPA